MTTHWRYIGDKKQAISLRKRAKKEMGILREASSWNNLWNNRRVVSMGDGRTIICKHCNDLEFIEIVATPQPMVIEAGSVFEGRGIDGFAYTVTNHSFEDVNGFQQTIERYIWYKITNGEASYSFRYYNYDLESEYDTYRNRHDIKSHLIMGVYGDYIICRVLSMSAILDNEVGGGYIEEEWTAISVYEYFPGELVEGYVEYEDDDTDRDDGTTCGDDGESTDSYHSKEGPVSVLEYSSYFDGLPDFAGDYEGLYSRLSLFSSSNLYKKVVNGHVYGYIPIMKMHITTISPDPGATINHEILVKRIELTGDPPVAELIDVDSYSWNDVLVNSFNLFDYLTTDDDHLFLSMSFYHYGDDETRYIQAIFWGDDEGIVVNPGYSQGTSGVYQFSQLRGHTITVEDASDVDISGYNTASVNSVYRLNDITCDEDYIPRSSPIRLWKYLAYLCSFKYSQSAYSKTAVDAGDYHTVASVPFNKNKGLWSNKITGLPAGDLPFFIGDSYNYRGA